MLVSSCAFFFFQAEDGIRDDLVTGVQTCALPIYERRAHPRVDRCFRINFQVLSGKAALDAYATIEQRNQELSQGRAAWAENFSYGGLGIVGDLDLVQDHGLDSKSFLSIELEIPGFWHTLRCVATVAWIKRDEAHGCFKAGV